MRENIYENHNSEKIIIKLILRLIIILTITLVVGLVNTFVLKIDSKIAGFLLIFGIILIHLFEDIGINNKKILKIIYNIVFISYGIMVSNIVEYNSGLEIFFDLAFLAILFVLTLFLTLDINQYLKYISFFLILCFACLFKGSMIVKIIYILSIYIPLTLIKKGIDKEGKKALNIMYVTIMFTIIFINI